MVIKAKVESWVKGVLIRKELRVEYLHNVELINTTKGASSNVSDLCLGLLLETFHGKPQVFSPNAMLIMLGAWVTDGERARAVHPTLYDSAPPFHRRAPNSYTSQRSTCLTGPNTYPPPPLDAVDTLLFHVHTGYHGRHISTAMSSKKKAAAAAQKKKSEENHDKNILQAVVSPFPNLRSRNI